MTKNNLKQALRNLPLIMLTVTVSFALEAFGWGYIWLTNDERVQILGAAVPMALVESIIISATGFLALIAAFVAAERQNDPRSEQRRLAFAAQVLAVALLVPPIFKAADAFAFPAQVDVVEAYLQSELYQTDLAQSRDQTLDSIAQRDAAASLQRGVRPTRAQFDLTWIASLVGAAFLYGVNMMAARLLWRAKPETPAERDRRIAAEDKARRRADRRRKEMIELELAKLEADKNRPAWLRGIFKGGRKAA